MSITIFNDDFIHSTLCNIEMRNCKVLFSTRKPIMSALGPQYFEQFLFRLYENYIYVYMYHA